MAHEPEQTPPADAGPVEWELGALPEPAAVHCYWRGDNDSASWDQWHDESDPMPDEWEDDEAPDEVTPHYTADQMRAYALEQRENWVTVVQNTESLLAHLLARGLPSTQYRMCERVLHQARELLGPNTHPKRGTPNE